MADKPKISHYAPSNPSAIGPSSTTPDRSRLAQLYPMPKTYDEMRQDDKQRQNAYRHRWPKRPSLNIAAYGSIIFGLSIWFLQNLNTWWFSSSVAAVTMSTVFFTFILALALAALVILWVKYIGWLFGYFGGSVQIFWLTHSVLIPVLIVIWLSGWTWQYTDILWVPSLTVLYFTMLLFSALRTIGKR